MNECSLETTQVATSDPISIHAVPPPSIETFDEESLKECSKRRRTEKGRAASGDSGTGSSISPQSVSRDSLSVERPSRAASSSPIGVMGQEMHLVRNRMGRTSLGSDFRSRVQSPSDKRVSLDFYKEALKRDSTINRSQFLSGHWLRQSTSKRVVGASKSDPPGSGRTSHDDSAVITRHSKRKLSNDCMDTT